MLSRKINSYWIRESDPTAQGGERERETPFDTQFYSNNVNRIVENY
jgi:hypothetical protein